MTFEVQNVRIPAACQIEIYRKLFKMRDQRLSTVEPGYNVKEVTNEPATKGQPDSWLSKRESALDRDRTDGQQFWHIPALFGNPVFAGFI